MKKNLKGVWSIHTPFYNLLDKGLLFLFVGLCLIFVLYPIICVVFQSITLDGSLSFEVYKNIIGENKKLLVNSVTAALLSSGISTFLALIVSLYVYFLSPKMNRIGKFFLMLSMISPPFIASLAYIQLFGKRGYITYHLLGMGFDPYGIHGVVIMQVIGFIPLSALMILAVIEKVDKRLLQASRDLGSSENSAIINILIPMIKPGIIVSFLLSFVRSLADFGTVTIIGGKFETIATEIYMEIIGYANFSHAASLNVLLFIPAILIFIPYRKNMKKLSERAGLCDSEEESGLVVNMRKGLRFFVTVISLGFFLVMIVQYICIFVSGFSNVSMGRVMFTTEYLKHVGEYNMGSFFRSIIYAFITGIVGSIIGIMVSYYIERRKVFGRYALDFITTLPYILPGTFFGIAYILAFNKKPLLLTGTAFIVIANCIFKQLPLTTKTSSAVLSQLGSEIEDASRDIGASRFHVIKDIIIPNVKEAFLVGFVNNFTSTMTTIGAIIFLIYPGKEMATITLFDAINSGEYGVASVISVIIILITLSINVLFTMVVTRKRVK